VISEYWQDDLPNLFLKWDTVRATKECPHCKGTGKCDENNECGFCHKEGEEHDGTPRD
jgi:DnaJ-class molecular chaperone